MSFDPFRFINPVAVQKKVKALKKSHPDLDESGLCLLVIRERSIQCALSGILTTLPAVFPVIGTLTALVGGITLDVWVVTYLLVRMVTEIRAIYGRDANGRQNSREALWVLASAVGADAVSKTVSRISASQMGNRAVAKIIQQILFSLGIRSTPRVAVRIIPLLGAAVAGGINYVICQRVGTRVRDYYSRREAEKGPVIDIEGEFRD